jgi:hypothetical protein
MTTQPEITLDELLEPIDTIDSAGPWTSEEARAGVVIHRQLLPHALVDAYAAEWSHARDHGEMPDDGGWTDCTPYMRYDALRATCCDFRLARALRDVLTEPAGVHLNLTGWISTERSWHQDGYLNPPHVGDYYAAVWIALDDITPDSGPFEWIPGSHTWGRLTRERMWAAMDVDGTDPDWPKQSEAILDPAVGWEIEQRALTISRFDDAQKGDVLIWHPRLMHRGSRPADPAAIRPALIAHYSGIMHRSDMPSPVHIRQWEPGADGDGGWYFPIESSGRVR